MTATLSSRILRTVDIHRENLIIGRLIALAQPSVNHIQSVLGIHNTVTVGVAEGDGCSIAAGNREVVFVASTSAT